MWGFKCVSLLGMEALLPFYVFGKVGGWLSRMLLRFVRGAFGLLKKKRYVAHIVDKMAMWKS